jgi:hypothetical protein
LVDDYNTIQLIALCRGFPHVAAAAVSCVGPVIGGAVDTRATVCIEGTAVAAVAAGAGGVAAVAVIAAAAAGVTVRCSGDAVLGLQAVTCREMPQASCNCTKGVRFR